MKNMKETPTYVSLVGRLNKRLSKCVDKVMQCMTLLCHTEMA